MLESVLAVIATAIATFPAAALGASSSRRKLRLIRDEIDVLEALPQGDPARIVMQDRLLLSVQAYDRFRSRWLFRLGLPLAAAAVALAATHWVIERLIIDNPVKQEANYWNGLNEAVARFERGAVVLAALCFALGGLLILARHREKSRNAHWTTS